MRKRTLKTLVATLAGAALGSAVMFGLLVSMGKRKPLPTPPAANVPVGTPAATPAGTPSPTASATPTADAAIVSAADRVVVEPLRVSFALPSGYRVASTLNALSGGRRPAQFTITKATEVIEAEYVALLRDLAEKQVATDAPTFSPGITITLHEITSPSPEEGDAPLASEQRIVSMSSGLAGTRLVRVQGPHTYDMTYVRLARGIVGVEMAYSSTEPRFDEGGYDALLRSLAGLD